MQSESSKKGCKLSCSVVYSRFKHAKQNPSHSTKVKETGRSREHVVAAAEATVWWDHYATITRTHAQWRPNSWTIQNMALENFHETQSRVADRSFCCARGLRIFWVGNFSFRVCFFVLFLFYFLFFFFWQVSMCVVVVIKLN